MTVAYADPPYLQRIPGPGGGTLMPMDARARARQTQEVNMQYCAQPRMTCDKCGMQRVVTKSPEATARWFKKYHKDCGKPVYQAGFSVGLTRLVGQ